MVKLVILFEINDCRITWPFKFCQCYRFQDRPGQGYGKGSSRLRQRPLKNVRSVWLCNRNDAIGNLAVIGAAAAVWFTASAWPDLVVAFVMASLFLHSAFLIVRHALRELRADREARLAELT